MDPFEFLGTAERLASLPAPEEADYRTVVSRLYYALFLTLRDGLAEKDRGFRSALRHSGADHSLVRRYLQGERFANGLSRGRMGQRVSWYETYQALHSWREQADYITARMGHDWPFLARQLLLDATELGVVVSAYVRR